MELAVVLRFGAAKSAAHGPQQCSPVTWTGACACVLMTWTLGVGRARRGPIGLLLSGYAIQGLITLKIDMTA